MFATLRRHQKWMWAAIIAVVIPSFVIFFTPDATLRSVGGSYGTINGKPIKREQFVEAYHETELYHFFSYGNWPSRDERSRQMGFDLERETLTRVMLVQALKDNQVHVSTEAAAQWIANMFRDRKQRVFRLDTYDQFVKELRREKGLRESDLERFAQHQVGIQHLVSLYGLNGKLVSPQAAESVFRQENEQIESEAVVFATSNYLAQVQITTNALDQYYTNQLSRYRIPDRVQVRYVKFDLTNAFAEADQMIAKDTNITQKINDFYLQRGASSFVETNGAPLAEAVAKEKIREAMRREFAQRETLRKASAFAEQVFNLKPVTANNLNQAATNLYPVRITAPFSQMEGPREFEAGANIGRIAFALTEEDPFAPPQQTADGVYVFALHKKLPSEIPPKESLGLRLTQDFRRAEALKLAHQQGESFQQTLTNSLASGKSFEAICAEAKVQPVVLPKFTMASRSLPELDERLELGLVQDLANELPPGRASRFSASADGGFVLYVKNRIPVDEAKVKQDLPAYLREMRQSRQFQAFEDWLRWQTGQAKLAGTQNKSAAE